MKQNVILFCILFFKYFTSAAQVPDFQWAKVIGGTGYEYSNAIAIDAYGNVYTTGSFRGTVDFDPGTGVFNLSSPVGEAIFISKLDASGNFVWAKAMAGYGDAYAITLNSSGDVYTTGKFYGTFDFNPGAGVFNLVASGNEDIFISKLDSLGNFVWARQMGGVDSDVGKSIALDEHGNIYTTGNFRGTVDFDPGVGSFNLVGFYGVFISKLDNAGNFVWAKAMGVNGVVYSNSIALDASGNVFTTGSFQHTVDFDPSSGVFNLVGSDANAFISKLDSSGNFVWAKILALGVGSGGVMSCYIALDTAGTGSIYTTGEFAGIVDFDPGTGVFYLLTGLNLSSDIFISKLDSSGNFEWAKSIITDTTNDYVRSIAVDPSGSGNVYITGFFMDSGDFDPGAATFNLNSSGNWDVFISKLDATGNFAWAKAMGGTELDLGTAIAQDGSDNVYVTGYFQSPSVSFDTTVLVNADVTGSSTDFFIARLDTSLITGSNVIESFGKDIRIYPNPYSKSTIISFSLSHPAKIDLKLYDMEGRLISSLTDKHFDAGENKLEWNPDVPDGIYFIHMQTDEINRTEKLIVIR